MYVCSFAHKTASTNRRSFNGGLRLTRQLCDTLNLDRTRERERLHGRFFGRQHELRMQYLEADKERRLLRCLTPRLILMVSGTFSAPKSVLVARLAYGRLRMAIKYGHSRVHIPALFARIAATLCTRNLEWGCNGMRSERTCHKLSSKSVSFELVLRLAEA